MTVLMNQIHFGDCRETMRRWAAEGVKVQTCVTSPPYFGLRDYGHEGQIGLEQTPDEYIAAMVEVFRCVKDVLADDGTLWLNIGDSYAANRAYQVPSTKGGPKHSDSQSAGGKGSIVPAGMKPKDLIGIPWMLAFALRADGWYLRQDIIWHKPNPMPESVRDRCTKAHEYIFLLSKSERYFYDHEASKEPSVSEKPAGNKRHKYADAYNAGTSEEHRTKAGLVALAGVEWETRNRRSVWTVATRPYKGAHFATFPPALIEPCILAGSRAGDIVLDPFMGSGTTAAVSLEHGRQYLGCELNPEYGPLQQQRITSVPKNQPALRIFSEPMRAGRPGQEPDGDDSLLSLFA
jgi:DNA modification methylase